MPTNDLYKGRISKIDQEYFITFKTNNRKPIFKDYEVSRIAINHILDVKEEAQWLVWVLMPDHFHGILKLKKTTLANVIRKIKSKSAIAINKKLNCSGAVWQSTYYDRALRKDQDRIQIARYIVANPLRAGLVKNIGDYPYWNSIWLK